MIKNIAAEWKNKKLKFLLEIFWLTTVFFSFWYQSILTVSFPLIGALSPFRIFLPLTMVTYLIWAVREKHFFWKESTIYEKWSYVFCAALLIYGAVSLLWSVDFRFSFRRLFNLAFDMCFFFLMLQLCKDKKVLQRTLWVVVIVLVIHTGISIYESFHGGVFSYPSQLPLRLYPPADGDYV